MTPDQLKTLTLGAKVGAGLATINSCAELIRAFLPHSPIQRSAAIQRLELRLESFRMQDHGLVIPGFADAEQHLSAELFREALEEAHNHLLAQLRK